MGDKAESLWKKGEEVLRRIVGASESQLMKYSEGAGRSGVDAKFEPFCLEASIALEEKDKDSLVAWLSQRLQQQFVYQARQAFIATVSYRYLCMKNKKGTGKVTKKTKCAARLNVTFYDRRKALQLGGAAKAKVCAMIYDCRFSLNARHNHYSSSSENTRHLKSGPELRAKFLHFFSEAQGKVTAAKATAWRRGVLRSDLNFQPAWLADASRMPKYSTVYRWLTEWKQSQNGLRDSEEPAAGPSKSPSPPAEAAEESEELLGREERQVKEILREMLEGMQAPLSSALRTHGSTNVLRSLKLLNEELKCAKTGDLMMLWMSKSASVFSANQRKRLRGKDPAVGVKKKKKSP